MDTILQENDRELDIHQLQIFDVLLAERSITNAARVLNLTQPALSKTLARLRRYFDDPLFVRVSLRMEPTPKALELAEPVRLILERMRALRSEHVSFDPKTSNRQFTFLMIDAAVVQMLPLLINFLAREAPGVRVQAIQSDLQHMDVWLESGLADIAIGSFPSLTYSIRRRPLWTETYASLCRKDHPRMTDAPSIESFIKEKHIIVSAVGTGHVHLEAEHVLESAIPRGQVTCRVPMFTSAALMIKHSDIIATLPRTLASTLAADIDLKLLETPLILPSMEISQYWHDRYHREPGNQWMRSVLLELFTRPNLKRPA